VPRENVRPWEAVEALARYDPVVHGRDLPHEPLWEPAWTRELVAAALTTRATGHTIDESRAVNTIAHGRPLTDVPLIPRRTLSRGVQVLVDVGEAMVPYARDRTQLVRQIGLVAGHSRVTVLRFSSTPLRGAGASGRPTWRRYAPPEPGTPVLALTDLGIGGHPVDTGRASAAAWLQLAGWLERRASRLIALVPYPPARWPTALRRAITILRWDRPTTVAEVLDRVLGGEQRWRTP
jgi:hypothetical protein